MRILSILNIVAALLLLGGVSGCSTVHHVNGWYPIADYPDNTIEGNAIMTVQDFATVKLDTITSSEIAVIEGRVQANKVSAWADATEKRIGKRIGFVYNDSVITAPQINCRITGGTFTISSENKSLILDIYSSIAKNRN